MWPLAFTSPYPEIVIGKKSGCELQFINTKTTKYLDAYYKFAHGNQSIKSSPYNTNMLYQDTSNHKCPSCGKKISARLRLHYCLYGKRHTIRCPHCDCELKANKGRLSSLIWPCLSGPIVIASFWGYIKFVEDSFAWALLFSFIIAAIYIFALCILTLYRIKFAKA